MYDSHFKGICAVLMFLPSNLLLTCALMFLGALITGSLPLGCQVGSGWLRWVRSFPKPQSSMIHILEIPKIGNVRLLCYDRIIRHENVLRAMWPRITVVEKFIKNVTGPVGCYQNLVRFGLQGCNCHIGQVSKHQSWHEK